MTFTKKVLETIEILGETARALSGSASGPSADVADAPTRYLVITKADADRIAKALGSRCADIADRLRDDTGGDIEEMAAQLKALRICPACSFESQGRSCAVPRAQKLGRRLARLLERARGDRKPGPGPTGGEP